jgi:hypothetical protein
MSGTLSGVAGKRSSSLAGAGHPWRSRHRREFRLFQSPIDKASVRYPSRMDILKMLRWSERTDRVAAAVKGCIQ